MDTSQVYLKAKLSPRIQTMTIVYQQHIRNVNPGQASNIPADVQTHNHGFTASSRKTATDDLLSDLS